MADYLILSKRVHLISLILLTMLFSGVMNSQPVKAETNNTTWQENYDYECLDTVDGEAGPFIRLLRYRGSESFCRVPSVAVINHKRYRTCLESVAQDNQPRGIWPYDFQNHRELYLEEGVKFGKDMSYVFFDCPFKRVVIDHCDTSKVFDMSSMFHSCRCLEKLDLTGFDTSHVLSMKEMFKSSTIHMLDISSFRFTEGSNTRDMFTQSHISSLRTPAYIPDTVDLIKLCKYADYRDIHNRSYQTLPVNRKSVLLKAVSDGEVFDCSGAVIRIRDQYAEGKELQPSFTLSVDGEKIQSAKYDVEYSNNIHAGTGIVKVVFDGIWSGKATGFFKIRPPVKKRIFQKDNALYKVTKNHREVTFLGLVQDKVSIVIIPDLVAFEGCSYQVTKIKKKALEGNKYIHTVIVGSNVKKIGKKALASCCRLRSIILNTRNIRDIMEAHFERMSSKSTNHGRKVKVFIKNKRARKELMKRKYRRMVISKKYRTN